MMMMMMMMIVSRRKKNLSPEIPFAAGLLLLPVARAAMGTMWTHHRRGTCTSSMINMSAKTRRQPRGYDQKSKQETTPIRELEFFREI